MIKTWWGDDEQDLLRIELRWFSRWLRTRECWAWLAACAALSCVSLLLLGTQTQISVFEAISRRVPGVFVNSVINLTVNPSVLVQYTILLILFHRRSLRLFRPEALPHIALSRIGPRDLWPAMLVAPTLAALCCSLVGLVAFAAIHPNWVFRFLVEHLNQSSESERDWFQPLALSWRMAADLISLLLHLFSVGIQALFLTTFLARLAPPRPRVFTLLLWATLGFMVTKLCRVVAGFSWVLFGTGAHASQAYQRFGDPTILILCHSALIFFLLRGLRRGAILPHIRRLIERV